MTDPEADPTQAPTPSAVVELAAACTAADGVAPFSGHVLDALADSRVDTVHRYGRLVGVAVLSAPIPAELAVHPDHRRQGIGGGAAGPGDSAVARRLGPRRAAGRSRPRRRPAS